MISRSAKLMRTLFCVAGVLLALGNASRADDRAVQGNGRGSPFRFDCGPNGYVVGFEGYAGGWIDRLSIVCGHWFTAGGKTQLWNISRQPPVGFRNGKDSGYVGASTGGGPSGAVCSGVMDKNPDQFIAGIVFPDAKGDGPTPVIHSIEFQCVAHNRAILSRGHFGSKTPPTITQFTSNCPAGQVATGLHGRSGTFIDALGLVCGPLPVVVEQPLEPINSQGPVAQNPPPTRRSNIDLGFTGNWDTRTDKGWRYMLTLSQDGRAVTGSYRVQDGTTGRIRGNVGAGQLQFDWEQDGGFRGTGQLSLAADGNSFSGVYTAQPHPKLNDARLLQGTWTGTRR